ncbi:MAG: hypothetical protein Q9P14_06380 [candidate division KSB1 bacterium]|nr:hypothetical protein [candidate division KSB1 bacterium]
MAIRLVDLGTVSYLRSQTVYHGVAYARTDHTPDTILLMNPKEPYVCVGFHQEVDKEVDMTFCREKGLPVLRREVGGGAVLLDENQMFTQWIMAPDRLPWNLNKRFQIYARPLVQTYHAFGIQAEFRPINDIHVSGRKIGGTGAAAIGQAEVMVGSFLFDFAGPLELMARANGSAFPKNKPVEQEDVSESAGIHDHHEKGTADGAGPRRREGGLHA